MKIGILGGGLTGLTLGYLFEKRNIDFQVLEKENRIGGLMQSITHEGFTFDTGGSHIIFSKDKEVLEFMISLLDQNIVKNIRNTKILYKNKYIKYPFENGLSDLAKEDNYECLYYFIENLLNKKEYDKIDNLQDWFINTFGKGISEKYLIPYNQKIWKYDLKDMTLKFVERIPNPPFGDIIKSSLGIKTEGYLHQLFFYYPINGGIQSIISNISKNIMDKVRLNTEIKNIEIKDSGYYVNTSDDIYFFDKLISTIPLNEFVGYLDCPKEVKIAANNLNYNSLISVMIGLNDYEVSDLSWLYIPDESIIFHRISFPSNYSPNNSPKNTTSILAEITCNYNDQIWNTNEENIIKKVISDLEKIKVINNKDICLKKLYKTRYAYVIYDKKYDDNVKKIKNWMNDNQIELLGRFSEFEYLNMDNCIKNVLNYFRDNYE